MHLIRLSKTFVKPTKFITFKYSTGKKNESFYDTLGVDKNCSDTEIKAAYKKLAMKYHPDRNPEGAEKFKDINNAYQVLSDPEKRKMYDMHGEEAINDSGFNYANPEDIFAQMFNQGFGGFGGFGGFEGFGGFGGGGGGRRRQTQQPAPITYKVSLNLQDFYTGTQKTFDVKRTEECQACDGFGTKNKQSPETCSKCKGNGFILETRQIGPGMIQQNQKECPSCRGSGEIIREENKCRECFGKKTAQGSKILKVNIQKGQNEGDLYYRGEGNQIPNGPKGDVIMSLVCNPHPLFTRKGDDLFMKHKISLRDALGGFSCEFQHLDGRVCSLVIEKEVIKPFHLKKIKGKGMPKLGKDSFGDLYVQFEIIFPEYNQIEDLSELTSKLPNTPQQTHYYTLAKEKLTSVDASIDESKKIFEEKKKETNQQSQRKRKEQEQDPGNCHTQ